MSLSKLKTSKGSLAFVENGEGETLFLWPSLFTDHTLYDDVIGALVDSRWRTIAIDGPGFGASTPPNGIVQPSGYADLVVELADRLQINKFYFAGTSWGGQIGAHLGAKHSDRISGLLLMNTPIEPSHGGHLFELWMTRILGNTAIAANGVARNFLALKTVESHPERVKRFTSAFASFDKRAAVQAVDTTLRHFDGIEALLARLTIPTTIMFGAEDALYPADRSVAMARSASKAEIVVVQDCGHLIPLEAPEAATRAVVGLRALVDLQDANAEET